MFPSDKMRKLLVYSIFGSRQVMNYLQTPRQGTRRHPGNVGRKFDTLVLCPLPNTSSSRQYFVINFGTLSFYFIKQWKNKTSSSSVNIFSCLSSCIQPTLSFSSCHTNSLFILSPKVTQHRYECHIKWTVYHTIHKTKRSVFYFFFLCSFAALIIITITDEFFEFFRIFFTSGNDPSSTLL
jgi:hypothetical protein